MRTTLPNNTRLTVFLALVAAVAVSLCVALGLGAQAAYADLQGSDAQPTSLETQAVKTITANGTYTFSGVYMGKSAISSKTVKGSAYKCTKGALTVKNIYKAFKGKSMKQMSGKSFKVKVAKNCKFYSVGSSDPIRMKAKEAITKIRNTQLISLQVVISGKQATKIYFGAW